MNENAKVWVQALRSGEWKQVTNALRRVEGGIERYCCLGVACEISAKGRWIEAGLYQDEFQVAERARRWEAARVSDNGCEECGEWICKCQVVSEEFASPQTVEWLGLKSEDGELVLDGMKTSLAKLNDAGNTFEEIADIIEANDRQLFED